VPEAEPVLSSDPTARSDLNPAARSAALVLAIWRPAHVAWGLMQLVKGPLTVNRAPGVRWRKVLGSGHEGGFGLRPGLNRLGLFSAFDGPEAARDWLDRSAEVEQWRTRAERWLTVLLEPVSSRGSWSGHTLTPPTPVAQQALGASGGVRIASLTRASIRPYQARRFWSLSPAAEASLARAPGCMLAVGLGEAPLLRQATFSLWQDQAAMDAYARSGAHLDAIRQAYSQGFFSESMFARFRVLEVRGNWPLSQTAKPARQGPAP